MESKNVSLKSSGKKDYKTGKNISGKSQLSTGSNTTSTGFNEENDQNSLFKVFEKHLKDIYTAELELVDALPKVMEAAYEEDFEDAIRDHLEETKRQSKRLEKIFTQLRIDKDDAEISEAMSALIGETNKIIDEFESGPVRDSALIICAQKVEHYEIAAYTTARNLALQLHQPEIVELLTITLGEEQNAGQLLDQVAQPLMSVARMPKQVL